MKDKKIGKTPTRRSFLASTTGLGLILATGTAPAFIREAGASKMRKVTFHAALACSSAGMRSSSSPRSRAGRSAASMSRSPEATARARHAKRFRPARRCSARRATASWSTGSPRASMSSPSAPSCRGARSRSRCRKDFRDQDGEGPRRQASGPGRRFGRHRDVSPASRGPRRSTEAKIKQTIVHPSKLISTVVNKQADCTGTYYVSNAATLASKTPVDPFPLRRFRAPDPRSRADHPLRHDQERSGAGAANGRRREWRGSSSRFSNRRRHSTS